MTGFEFEFALELNFELNSELNFELNWNLFILRSVIEFELPDMIEVVCNNKTKTYFHINFIFNIKIIFKLLTFSNFCPSTD